MTRPESGIYFGNVVHRRLRPIRHAFKYRVFSMFLEIDELDTIEKSTRFFSYNSPNLFSLYDSDHGNGEPLRDYLQSIVKEANYQDRVCRLFMLCYPRMFGYTFNPLTVYFGLDADDQPCLLIYEVNNTFGGRQTYVLPANSNQNGLVSQRCQKQLYVSPFNSESGTYSFVVSQPNENLTVGVKLRDEIGPLLVTHFRAEHQNLSDKVLLTMLLQTGWMTIKVIAGIHYEAARLWLKGLKLVPKPHKKPHTISHLDSQVEK